jgi:hypothetical protein
LPDRDLIGILRDITARVRGNNSNARLAIGALAVLIFTVLPCALAQVPDAEYSRIYGLIAEGEVLSVDQPAQALKKFREAYTALQKFQQTYPTWNRSVVKFRLDDLASKLTTTAATSPVAAAPTSPASGLFPRIPPATNVCVVEIAGDSRNAKMTARALQGMINQQGAEVYLINNPWDREPLESCGRPRDKLPKLPGTNGGLRTLFQKYQARVKKMFIYDPEKDWTWYLALMAAAQQNGIPITEPHRNTLTTEFGWKGEVEDFRSRWTSRIQAYDWALEKLMPGCSKQVVFALRTGTPLIDYAAATKGFVFWLDFKTEVAEIEKIFKTRGYGVGTSLMGYGSTGDDANRVANRFGIGYITSELYANGSFWPSFVPQKTYTQRPGRAVPVEAGKIYAHIMWSDGDNLEFDQNPLYKFWHDPARGKVPVATALAPTLQELNAPLLDWYYSRLTDNDELMAGPAGVQFIYIRDFRDDLFPAWCRLTRIWCQRAGFQTVRIWIAPNPSLKYSTYMQTCGFTGILGEGWSVKAGFPPKLDTTGAANEGDLYQKFIAVRPNPREPVFCGFTCIVQGFYQGDRGYSAIKRQIDRLERAHPGRYVFLLPKDQFATIRAYYHTALPQVLAQPEVTEGLRAVNGGDGQFTIVEREGARCWLQQKSHYFYLDVDDRFRPHPGQTLEIELEYFDAGSGEIRMEYDSTDARAPLGGAYKTHPQVIRRLNKAQWQTARFRVNDAGFGSSQNGGSDFRFSKGDEDLLIRAARVRRVGF